MTDQNISSPPQIHPVSAWQLPAILEGLQDQISDLTATVEAQQRRIDDLTRRLARHQGR